MLFFFAVAKYFSQETSLRVTPIIFGLLQFAVLIPLSRLLSALKDKSQQD